MCFNNTGSCLYVLNQTIGASGPVLSSDWQQLSRLWFSHYYPLENLLIGDVRDSAQDLLHATFCHRATAFSAAPACLVPIGRISSSNEVQ